MDKSKKVLSARSALEHFYNLPKDGYSDRGDGVQVANEGRVFSRELVENLLASQEIVTKDEFQELIDTVQAQYEYYATYRKPQAGTEERGFESALEWVLKTFRDYFTSELEQTNDNE